MKATIDEAVQQILGGLEVFAELCANRAVERVLLEHKQFQVEDTWISAKEAARILGFGYSDDTIRKLYKDGDIIGEKINPEAKRSHLRIWKPSLFHYNQRRVTELMSEASQKQNHR
jgi:hypothetical protein